MARHGAAKIRACYDRLFEVATARLRRAVADWKDGRHEAERFVDDDGIELERPVRIHVVVDKRGDDLHFDFTASDDQTKGPANIRPTAGAGGMRLLPDLADRPPYLRVQRIAAGILDHGAGRQRARSALPGAGQHLQSDHPCAGGRALRRLERGRSGQGACRRQRQPVDHSRRPQHPHGRNYVQYEIVAGGAGARATKDGASGITVNQSNARIAPVEIIESEFPTRLLRFDLIPDSGGAGRNRGGLGCGVSTSISQTHGFPFAR